MVEEYTDKDKQKVSFLFDSHTWLKTVIQFAFRDNAGRIIVDNIQNPEVGFLQIGFVFLGGNSSSRNVAAIIDALPAGPQIIAPTSEWEQTLTNRKGESIKRVPRIGFSYDSLNLDYLRSLKEQIPLDFVLERIDLETASSIPGEVAPAIPFFFRSPESFIERGFGYCIKHNRRVVSTAMTAMPFEKEFEIEVDTLNNPEYRRKGLATAVSAALIEEALLKDLVPIWDAANEASKRLALRLGYSNPISYDAFSIIPDVSS